MAAPAKNQFWQLRSKHGRNTLFETPELLWEAACEYFEWCEENPLMEVELVSYQGITTKEELPKMRAFTMQGLCLYLDCNTVYFNQFKTTDAGQREGFSKIIRTIEETVYNQKFTGAAAGFLNANLISRDLGLSDKTQIETTGDTVIRVVYEDDNKTEAPPPGTEAGT